jgi:hypothetical protein
MRCPRCQAENPDEDHAVRACYAAVRMQESVGMGFWLEQAKAEMSVVA